LCGIADVRTAPAAYPLGWHPEAVQVIGP